MGAGARRARSAFATFWANASYKSFAKNACRESEAEEPGIPLSNSTSHERAPSVLEPEARRAPSSRLTARQLLYILGTHGFGAMCISGGVNFAIAYAMYTTTNDPIRLFQLPNTLAGDTAVTVIVQTLVTWLVELLLINRDLRKGSIPPIGFIAEPSSRAVRWFMLLDLPEQEGKGRGAFWRRFLYVLGQAVRAFAVSVVCFCILFGPSVGIMMVFGVRDGGDWDFASRWAPEVFKLVLGGVLALMTTPFFAMFWMVKCGWDGGVHEAVMVEANENK